jgi:hypothetical protein
MKCSVDRIRHPVDRMSRPEDRMGYPGDRMKCSVDRMKYPVDGIRRPEDGSPPCRNSILRGRGEKPVGGGDASWGRHLTEAAQPQAWLTRGAPPPSGESSPSPGEGIRRPEDGADRTVWSVQKI